MSIHVTLFGVNNKISNSGWVWTLCGTKHSSTTSGCNENYTQCNIKMQIWRFPSTADCRLMTTVLDYTEWRGLNLISIWDRVWGVCMFSKCIRVFFRFSSPSAKKCVVYWFHPAMLWHPIQHALHLVPRLQKMENRWIDGCFICNIQSWM